MESKFMKGDRIMNDSYEAKALIRAILELIDKCDTIEELRERIKRIMREDFEK